MNKKPLIINISYNPEDGELLINDKSLFDYSYQEQKDILKEVIDKSSEDTMLEMLQMFMIKQGNTKYYATI